MVLPLVSALHLAVGGRRLEPHIGCRVAPGAFVGTIAGQTTGPFTATVDGSFETNTHGGPIALRARTVTVG